MHCGRRSVYLYGDGEDSLFGLGRQVPWTEAQCWHLHAQAAAASAGLTNSPQWPTEPRLPTIRYLLRYSVLEYVPRYILSWFVTYSQQTPIRRCIQGYLNTSILTTSNNNNSNNNVNKEAILRTKQPLFLFLMYGGATEHPNNSLRVEDRPHQACTSSGPFACPDERA